MGYCIQRVLIGFILLSLALSAAAVSKRCRKAAYQTKGYPALAQPHNKKEKEQSAFFHKYCTQVASVVIPTGYDTANVNYLVTGYHRLIQLFQFDDYSNPPFAPPRYS